MEGQPTEFEPVTMDSEDDLFIAYTSGTTNKPRRIVHSQAGFVLLAAFTHKVHVSVDSGHFSFVKLPSRFTTIEDISMVGSRSQLVSPNTRSDEDP